MDYKYIDQLLERYWKGDTSLEEEAILRSFFSQTDIPGHLKRYKELFTLAAIERDECALGSDFDTRMLALAGDEEPVKAHHQHGRQAYAPVQGSCHGGYNPHLGQRRAGGV